MTGDQGADFKNEAAVKSATRVLDLFEYLGRWDSERTHAEIAEELAIPKSSLSQLLKTLVRREYLNYVPETKGYALGSAIARLAKASHDSEDLLAMSAPILQWITSETGETSALNVIKGEQSQVANSVSSPHRLSYHMRQGDLAPLYATSGGKALLAFMPDEMQKEYFSKVVFQKFARNTHDSINKLRTELVQIRKTNLAFVVEEFTPGIAGVAKVIRDSSGEPLASINVAVPVARFDATAKKLCIATLNKALETIDERMKASRSGTR